MGTCGRFRECQKYSFWQCGRYFWHFEKGFWQITFVRMAEKPENRAFVRGHRECQNLIFGSVADVFGILR